MEILAVKQWAVGGVTILDSGPGLAVSNKLSTNFDYGEWFGIRVSVVILNSNEYDGKPPL